MYLQLSKKTFKTSRIFNLLAMIFLTGTISAQTPDAINYQAAVRDNNGNVLAGQAVDFRFTVYSGPSASIMEYQESHSTTTNDFGLVNLQIGNGPTVTYGTFGAIAWETAAHHLKMEVDTGSGYADLGTMQLVSVPYALAAKKVTDLKLADINGMPTAAPAAGQIIKYDGSSWVLDSIVDTDDQILSLSGQSLSISNGNTVSLPTAKTYSAGAGLVLVNDTFHAAMAAPIWNAGMLNGHAIAAGIPTDSSFLRWDASSSHWKNVTIKEGLWTKSGTEDIHYQGRAVWINDTTGQDKIEMFVHPLRLGILSTKGPNGNPNVRLTASSTNPDLGYFEINNDSGQGRVSALVLASGEGYIQTAGPNGFSNARFTTLLGYPNNAYLAIDDSTGATQAGIYVDASGNGIVFGDQKNFRIKHPSHEGKEIWYGSLEGPELAAYLRGTATLANGQAEISFPEHYRIVANPNTMTVVLTPLDATSNGLAVVEKTAGGFTVKELGLGTGNYSFDWEVKCVRRGHEEYKVVRDASDCLPAASEAPVSAMEVQQENR